MDTSIKSSKKTSNFYFGQTFLWSFDELSFQWATIIITLFTMFSCYSLKCSFDLFEYSEEQAKFENYWRNDKVCRTYVIEEKLRRGDNLWFFMKNTKTGETYDRSDISVSMWMEKNIGDTIVVTSTRIKDSHSSYDNTPGPAVKKLGKFKTYWMNGVLPAVLLMVIIFMLCGGKFDIYSYSKRDRLGCDVTSKEASVDRLIRTALVLFWVSTALFVMIRGMIFASI